MAILFLSLPCFHLHSHGNYALWTNTLRAISFLHSRPSTLHLHMLVFLLWPSIISLSDVSNAWQLLGKAMAHRKKKRRNLKCLHRGRNLDSNQSCYYQQMSKEKENTWGYKYQVGIYTSLVEVIWIKSGVYLSERLAVGRFSLAQLLLLYFASQHDTIGPPTKLY